MEKIRLVILLDIPAETRRQRKVKREFESFLYKNGFALLQAGVYTRLTDGRSSAEAHKRRLHDNTPAYGTVRLFMMTETQFQNSIFLAGEDNAQECEIMSQLDIFL